nr:uncharacterized protein LOC127303463 [Lolium perenne]
MDNDRRRSPPARSRRVRALPPLLYFFIWTTASICSSLSLQPPILLPHVSLAPSFFTCKQLERRKNPHRHRDFLTVARSIPATPSLAATTNRRASLPSSSWREESARKASCEAIPSSTSATAAVVLLRFRRRSPASGHTDLSFVFLTSTAALLRRPPSDYAAPIRSAPTRRPRRTHARIREPSTTTARFDTDGHCLRHARQSPRRTPCLHAWTLRQRGRRVARRPHLSASRASPVPAFASSRIGSRSGDVRYDLFSDKFFCSFSQVRDDDVSKVTLPAWPGQGYGRHWLSSGLLV